MARQKPPEEPEDDVPAWVMTFSDVITLLMTFFILLLTFATNEPETFDRMKTSMFGGGGSAGFAGSVEGMEEDTVLMRERARSGRIAREGSELPPLYSDPGLATLDKGIAGLEPEEERVLGTTHQFTQAVASVVNGEGITGRGKQQLKMLAKQMRKQPLHLDLVVHGETHVDAALAVVKHLIEKEGVVVAAVGVGVAPHRVDNGKISMVLEHLGGTHGAKN